MVEVAQRAPEAAAELILSLAHLVGEQRTAMQRSDWVDLERVLLQMRSVMDKIQASRGGAEGFRTQLQDLAPQERARVDDVLYEANVDRQISAELIRLNLHRFNALRAMRAHAEGVDGYDRDGRAIAHGVRLSTRA